MAGRPELREDEIQHLLRAAHAAAQMAYSPYSKFQVGAALLAMDEEIYIGCNVENVSYGLTICAERAAVFRAVAAGKSPTREDPSGQPPSRLIAPGESLFRAIAIATSSPHPVMPCGACRQVLREFGQDLAIFAQGKEGPYVKSSIAELLPREFGPEDLPVSP